MAQEDEKIQFEYLEPWNEQTESGDTGLSARLKWQRNFDKIRMWIASLPDNFRNLVVDSLTIGGTRLDGVADQSTPDSDNSKILTFLAATQRFLSKVNADVAAGHITFEDGLTSATLADFLDKIRVQQMALLCGGAQFGSTFAPGLTGFGGQIDNGAHAELRSLTLWEWLEVPELRYNRTEVVVGNVWRAPGGGIIESVEPISATEGYATLKLEDGEIGKIAVGDICMGVFHQYVSDDDEEQEIINDTEDSDDSKGNFHFSGFYTVYFTVKEITETDHNSQFKYEIRPASTVWPTQHHPCAQMNFVAYGNFTDTTRQSSRYSTLTYERYLRGVATWNFEEGNIAAQFGDLSNLSIHGLEMEGYSAYLNNIYMSGHMKQIDDALAQLSQYNVEFSDHIDVITVDDAGNVIGGLYKIDPQTQEKYDFRINSAMQVRKNGTLLTQVASREYNTDGTFVVYAEPVGCTCEIRNSTIYITSITNVKDGVAGSGDDDDFDYDAMRLVRNCYVNLLFDCEGRTTFTKQFPVTIEHDSEPFVGADLDNEHSGVSWITRTQSYIGLPSFNMKMWRNNEALNIASVNDTSVRTDTQGVTLILRNTTVPPVTIVPDRIYYYKTIVNGQLHVQITAIGADIPLIVNLNVTASVEYAGVSYERTLVHTITKTTDTNVYSLLPSPTEVIDDGTSLSVSAVDCAVVCDSSDDNHYNVPFSDFATHKIVVQYRFIYANGQQGTMTTYNGSPVQVSRSDNIARVEWFLYGRLTTGLPDTTVEHDREGVPVVKNGDSVYTWIKYADSVGGSGYPSVMYDAPRATTEYIGIAHNKQIPTESSIPSDYEWAKIKGNDGTSFTPKGHVILHYVSRSAMEQDVQQPVQGDYYLCDGDATTPAARATYYRGSWQYDTSASQGDAYVTTDGVQEGHIWVLDGYSWVDLGKIQGPQGPQGPQGLSGCHERLFVGYEPGHEYFNQEDDNTAGVRYVDFIAIENATMASGYSVYMCKTTHTGAVTWTADNTPENWEEVSINAQSAYFRFLITDAVFAKMAHFGAMIIDANWMLTTYGTLYRPATGESWRIDANHSAENVPIGISGGVEILRTYTPDNVCEKFDANYPNRQGYPSGTPSQEDVLYYYNFVPTSAKNMLTGAAYEGEMHIEGYIRSKGLMLNVEYWNKFTHYGDFAPDSYTPISGDVDELLFAPGTYQDPTHEYRNNLRLPLPWECPGKKFRFVNNMPYDATKVGYGNPTCYIRIGQPLDAEEWYGITDFFTLDGDWINQKVEEYSEEGENPMVKPDPGLYYDDSSSTIKIGEPIIPIIEIAGRNMTNNNRGGTVTIVNNGNTPGVTDNMTLNNVRSFSLYALPLPEAHDTHQRYWHWLLYDIEWYNE